MPRYIENEDKDRATITPSSHACDPVCRRCSTHFLPGRGCADLCDAISCCGCCDEAEKSDNTVIHDGNQTVEEDEMPAESHGQHNPPIQFPDLISTMDLLVNFLFSDAESQVDFDRGVYRAVIKALGGREPFVNMMYEMVNPAIKALKGQIITPAVLHSIRLKQASVGTTWKDPHGGYLDFVTHVNETMYLRPYGTFESPHVKHRIVQLLCQSPDPEIRQWADIRNNPDHPMGRKLCSDKLPARQYMDREGYYNAIREAIKTSSNVEEALSIQVDEEIWAPFEQELMDPQSWSQSTLIELQRNETTMVVAETVSPVGTSEASIGVVFETSPLHDYYDKDAVISVPWGLRESGLQDTNSLIWPFDLRKYTHIPGTFQVTPAPPVNRKILHAATQKLIAGSRLRIIILCGCIEDVVIPPHAWPVTLTLNDIRYDSWIETRQDKIARIFVRAPVPLSELWSSHGRQAFELSTIFLFVSAVLDVTIFPKFYESAMALTLMVRGLDNERLGKIPGASPATLEPILRTWLADKGFKEEDDLLRLAKAAGGSLRYGILVLSLSLPRMGTGLDHRKVTASKEIRRGVIPRGLLDEVRSLRNEVCGQSLPSKSDDKSILQANDDLEYPIDNEEEPEPDTLSTGTDLDNTLLDEVRSLRNEVCGQSLPSESGDESILQAIDDLEYPVDNEEEPEPDTFSTGMDLDNTLTTRESTTSLSSFRERFNLMMGNKYRVRKEGPRKSVTIRHCTISFTMTEAPADGFFWVKVELSPVGQRHPHSWATEVQGQDPGARLAFRIYLKDNNGDTETWSTYPFSSTWEACCQANSLVDAFEGDAFSTICEKPRRYIYIDERNKGLMEKYPNLSHFRRGAYTGENMEIIPAQGRLRGRKYKRRRNNEDTSERKRARMLSDGRTPSN
ncbi:hypothetical protein BJX99DRAFT_272814 [Aspergillus californicus]